MQRFRIYSLRKKFVCGHDIGILLITEVVSTSSQLVYILTGNIA
jgi:hypothetical protein